MIGLIGTLFQHVGRLCGQEVAFCQLRNRCVNVFGIVIFLLIFVDSVQTQQEGKGVLKRVDSRNLPNAMWVHSTVMSGGMPAGKPAFEELARLGIKTVISVDGIKPDVEGAAAAGLRYVHLPHGYDGISEERLLQLTKAVRDLPGPVYIHCHHGRHRSPAASAAVCISLGQLTPSEGIKVLEEAGTNQGFRGLIQAVENAAPISSKKLDEMQIEFIAASEVPPIVESMVAMDAIFDRLKDQQQRGWKDSGLEAISDALMLKEHFMELHRSESEKKQEVDFLTLLEQGRTLAEQLESHLQSDRPKDSVQRVTLADSVLRRLSSNCSQCHRQYRDNR
jgi:protein tyrosine phosphatase (PTP) superfamily phosphohydrolase (DUF442 family)